MNKMKMVMVLQSDLDKDCCINLDRQQQNLFITFFTVGLYIYFKKNVRHIVCHDLTSWNFINLAQIWQFDIVP